MKTELIEEIAAILPEGRTKYFYFKDVLSSAGVERLSSIDFEGIWAPLPLKVVLYPFFLTVRVCQLYVFAVRAVGRWGFVAGVAAGTVERAFKVFWGF